MAFDGFAERSQQSRRGARPADELVALQRQAGVLAHDFNNLLGVILAANEALAERLPEGSDSRELARLSQDAAERGAELLQRLVDLTRPEGGPQTLVDCAEAARSTVRMARMSAPEGVTVTARAGEAPLLCAADRAGLDSALLNLCVNAGHATPRGGSVIVAAESVELEGAAAAALALPPGRYVAVSVADTGVGMSPQVLARATDPYFTTRAGRGGSGLGLSSVQDFAARVGGRLDLVSAEGRGTTATLYLPRA